MNTRSSLAFVSLRRLTPSVLVVMASGPRVVLPKPGFPAAVPAGPPPAAVPAGPPPARAMWMGNLPPSIDGNAVLKWMRETHGIPLGGVLVEWMIKEQAPKDTYMIFVFRDADACRRTIDTLSGVWAFKYKGLICRTLYIKHGSRLNR